MTQYGIDRDSNYYLTIQDAVVGVLTEEQVKTWLSSFFEYFDTFMKGGNKSKPIAREIGASELDIGIWF